VARRQRRAVTARPITAFKLSLVFLFLVGINVYVFFFSAGSLKSVSRAAQVASLPPSKTRPAVVPVEPQWTAREGAVRAGEGLGSALRRDGLPAAEVDRLLRALRPLLDFRRDIVVGQKFRVASTAGGRVVSFEMRAAGVVYAVARAPNGAFIAGKGRLRKKDPK
jgi:hypothetical protein